LNGSTPMIDAAFTGTLGAFALDARFCIPATGVTGLFGPSGCGKTTVLRCLAGLQRLPGKLVVGGEIWQDDACGIFRKPHERPIGYVFQEASLFSHLSVRENLMFGADRTKTRGAVRTIALDDILDLLGLGPLLDRAPGSLSGGERQRVAMGRALMAQPRLLLLDEPLSALDRLTKDEILPYLDSLHKALPMPSLYVSHDITEIERLSDSLVLMEGGRVIANGPLAQLEADPSLPLMRAPDAAVTLAGRVADYDDAYGLLRLAVAGGLVTAPSRQACAGDRRRLRIKASDVSCARIRPSETSILNCLPARILSVHPQPKDNLHVNIVAGLGDDGLGDRIVGRVTRKSRDMLALAPGTFVFAQIKSVAVMASD